MKKDKEDLGSYFFSAWLLCWLSSKPISRVKLLSCKRGVGNERNLLLARCQRIIHINCYFSLPTAAWIIGGKRVVSNLQAERSDLFIVAGIFS